MGLGISLPSGLGGRVERCRSFSGVLGAAPTEKENDFFIRKTAFGK